MKVSAPSRSSPPLRGPPHGSEAHLSPSHQNDWNTERYARDARFVPALGRAVLDGVVRTLRPGGRFVAEMGGAGTVNRIFQALLDVLDARGLDGRAASPWVFPDPETYETALDAAGLRVLRMENFERPTELDCAMTDWLEIFAPTFSALLPGTRRACFLNDVARRLEPDLFDRDRGLWWVDYVRLRFAAVKT